MEQTIEQAIRLGVAAHKEGRLQDAERFYQAILRSAPLHPDANHNLGVLAVSVNEVKAALPLFKTALEVNPEVEQFWLSYIDALIKENKFNDAKLIIDQAKKQGVDQTRLKPFEAQLLPKSQKTHARKSPPEELLKRLFRDYQSGQFGNAENLAKSIIDDFPEHDLAWKVLGTIFQATGRFSEALNANRRVVALSPQAAEAHFNLGNALKEMGRLPDAEASYKQAITLKPDLAEAHDNLGLTLQEMGRLRESEVSFNQAIALKPELSGAYSNLSITLKELGRLKDAEVSCNRAIALKPDNIEALHNLSIIQNYMGKVEAEIISLESLIQKDASNYGLIAAVSLAICKFLEGNYEGSRNLLLESTKILEKTSSQYKNEKIYWGYLSNILKWHKKKWLFHEKGERDKILYVLGESHSLSSHHLRVQYSGMDFFCIARLIKGCKQWHLGNASMNKYKQRFEDIFLALPKNSYVLLAIGEIDCRLDTGIIAHKKKFPEQQTKEIVLNTIENYLNYIVKNNSDCQHTVTIQGVPCQNLDVKNHSDKEIRKLDELLEMFNYELKIKSRDRGFGFLDTHQLTNRSDGMPDGYWHIDDYHLSPEGMQEAWRRSTFEKSYEQS